MPTTAERDSSISRSAEALLGEFIRAIHKVKPLSDEAREELVRIFAIKNVRRFGGALSKFLKREFPGVIDDMPPKLRGAVLRSFYLVKEAERLPSWSV